MLPIDHLRELFLLSALSKNPESETYVLRRLNEHRPGQTLKSMLRAEMFFLEQKRLAKRHKRPRSYAFSITPAGVRLLKQVAQLQTNLKPPS